MALVKSNNQLDTKYSGALIRRNSTSYHEKNWQLPGSINPDISGVNAKYDVNNPPFGLGSGVFVDTNGRYLLDPANGPVSQFLVFNAGTATIYAGTNIETSGAWSSGLGLAIAPDASFEFGEPGTQVIRNVWAIASTSSQQVQGVATNILTRG